MLIELTEQELQQLMMILDKVPVQGLEGATALLKLAQKLNTPYQGEVKSPNKDSFINER